MGRLFFVFVIAFSSVIASFSNETWAQSQPTDFAVYSFSEVVMRTYSAVGGDIYSAGNITCEFGYGIQEPDINMGDMFAYDNFLLESLSDVFGDVYANGSITVEGSGEIHGQEYSGAGTVLTVLPPSATSFQAGTTDVELVDGQTLEPGAYGDVTQASSFQTVVLTSGDYYLKSLSTNTGCELNLLITDGPIHVFVEETINLGTGMDVRVNGVLVGTDGDASIQPLASQVLFETHGDFNLGGGFSSRFFGTIFAPFGDVLVDTQEFYGAIVAAGRVEAESYVVGYPSDYLIENAGPNMVIPEGYNVFRGVEIGGGIVDVAESDNVDFRFNPGFTLNSSEAPVRITFTGESQLGSASLLTVNVEAGASTVNLNQTVEVFNWNTFSFDQVDQRETAFNQDQLVSVDLSGDLSNYMDNDGTVAVQVSWKASGFLLNYPWEIGIDHVFWEVQ